MIATMSTPIEINIFFVVFVLALWVLGCSMESRINQAAVVKKHPLHIWLYSFVAVAVVFAAWFGVQ